MRTVQIVIGFMKNPKLPYFRKLKRLIYNYLGVYTYRAFVLPRLVKEKAHKDQLVVVFMAMNPSMWKVDSLYRLLANDSRYRVYVVAAVSTITKDVAGQLEDQDKLRSFFDSIGIKMIDGLNTNTHCWFDVKTLNPDIMFYTQPYDDNLCPEYSFHNFKRTTLLCYVPYGYYVSSSTAAYNLQFQNYCWKQFWQVAIQMSEAKRISMIHGRNMVVTGFPAMDRYLKANTVDKDALFSPTKKYLGKKVLIWAPHHTISGNKLSGYNMSTFLMYYDEMVNLRRRHSAEVFWIFKPHPNLYPTLLQIWGEAKTNQYYAEWRDSDDSILADGDYYDLFLASDAMIHDSGSFMAEYLFVRKPVMYLYNKMNSIGNGVLVTKLREAHYSGYSAQDIHKFVSEVVLAGRDALQGKREEIFKKVLLPPNNQLAGKNILDDIGTTLDNMI